MIVVVVGKGVGIGVIANPVSSLETGTSILFTQENGQLSFQHVSLKLFCAYIIRTHIATEAECLTSSFIRTHHFTPVLAPM